MKQLAPFELEDFLAQYEHREDLLNLASSDAEPWSIAALIKLNPDFDIDFSDATLSYPDLKAEIISTLSHTCTRPPGFDVLPTGGAAEALFLALAAAQFESEGGLSVAIPYPAYGAYGGISRLLNYRTRQYPYSPRESWKVDFDALLSTASHCDLVIVNNPHNPTGHLLTTTEMQELSAVMSNRNGTVLVDEVFRLPDDVDPSIDYLDNVVSVTSLSKVYGLPGLRFGWVCANSDRIGRMRTIQQYTSLSPSLFTARFGRIALENLRDLSRHEILKRNRLRLTAWASANRSLLSISAPMAGTTVVMQPRCSAKEDVLFQAFLQHKVLLAPGNKCFGNPIETAWFRLGYGMCESKLMAGLNAISATLSEI